MKYFYHVINNKVKRKGIFAYSLGMFDLLVRVLPKGKDVSGNKR